MTPLEAKPEQIKAYQEEGISDTLHHTLDSQHWEKVKKTTQQPAKAHHFAAAACHTGGKKGDVQQLESSYLIIAFKQCK